MLLTVTFVNWVSQLQSLVLYGTYFYAMERCYALVSSGCRVGLRHFFGGNFWRVDCPFVDDVNVSSVTLYTWPVTTLWKEEVVVDHVVTLLSCLDPMPSISFVVVTDHMEVGRSLALWAVPSFSVVMRFFVVHGLQRCFRKQLFKQRVGGIDPYNVL